MTRSVFVRALMKGCQYLLVALLVALTYEYFIIPARTIDVCVGTLNLSYQHAFYKDYGGKTFADTFIGDSLEVMAKQYNWR